MSDTNDYTPAKVWTWESESGGKFNSLAFTYGLASDLLLVAMVALSAYD